MQERIDQLASYKCQLAYTDSVDEYRGQTALHLAIARYGENSFPLIFILRSLESNRKRLLRCALFSKNAVGTSPKYTCLLGQTPIAAAFINQLMDKESGRSTSLLIMLRHGADITQINTLGDTVLHSIVRYAKLTEEDIRFRLDELLDNCDLERTLFSEKLDICSKMQNNENCTPLQLALKLSVVSMVSWLIETFHQRWIFEDGTSHIELYNVRELDTVTNRIILATPKDDDDTKRGREDWHYERKWKPHSPSGLEMMFSNNFSSNDALDMMDIQCIKCLISEKWAQEKLIFYIFGILYFVVLILITIYSVNRKNMNLSDFNNGSLRSIHNLNTSTFSKLSEALSYVSTIISFVALVLSATLLTGRFFFKPNPLSQTLHNLDYAIMFWIFSIMLVLDCLLINVKSNHGFEYNGELLLISLVFGWSFSTMFLRIFPSCGHLIDLLRQVIFSHIISFLSMITIINIAFATCFFDFLCFVEDDKGNFSENENFQSFWRTLYTMFTVTIGLNEMETIFDSRNSWFVILLFIIFMIIVYLLILNFLIAVMTETCTRIFSRRKEQQTLHKLSSILFIEDMFLLPVLFLPPLQKLRVKGISKKAQKTHLKRSYKITDNRIDEEN